MFDNVRRGMFHAGPLLVLAAMHWHQALCAAGFFGGTVFSAGHRACGFLRDCSVFIEYSDFLIGKGTRFHA